MSDPGATPEAPPGWVRAFYWRGWAIREALTPDPERSPRAGELPWLVAPMDGWGMHAVYLPFRLRADLISLRRALNFVDDTGPGPALRVAHAHVVLVEAYGLDGARLIVACGPGVVRDTVVALGAREVLPR